MSIIETERLFLRNLELSDIDTIYDYRNNEECNRYQRWDDFVKKDIEAFIQRFQADIFLYSRRLHYFGDIYFLSLSP